MGGSSLNGNISSSARVVAKSLLDGEGGYVHGSAQYVNSLCPMFGIKQACGQRYSRAQRRMWRFWRWHPGGTAFGGLVIEHCGGLGKAAE